MKDHINRFAIRPQFIANLAYTLFDRRRFANPVALRRFHGVV